MLQYDGGGVLCNAVSSGGATVWKPEGTMNNEAVELHGTATRWHCPPRRPSPPPFAQDRTAITGGVQPETGFPGKPGPQRYRLPRCRFRSASPARPPCILSGAHPVLVPHGVLISFPPAYSAETPLPEIDRTPAEKKNTSQGTRRGAEQPFERGRGRSSCTHWRKGRPPQQLRIHRATPHAPSF